MEIINIEWFKFFWTVFNFLSVIAVIYGFYKYKKKSKKMRMVTNYLVKLNEDYKTTKDNDL